MLKLIIGLKGTGKTKQLIEMVNTAVDNSIGSVVCIEKSDKLRFDIKYQCRLIAAEDYSIDSARSLYGFIAGIYASNHDITEIFVDSALKICGDDSEMFDLLLDELARLTEKHGFDVVMTSTIDESAATETMKKYI